MPTRRARVPEPTPDQPPAAPPPPPARRLAGQRAGVTRHDVLVAAQRVVERDGLDQLTMRRLAAELGVAPNALYTYFPDKTALLDALLDAVLADVAVPPIPRGTPDGTAPGGWQDGLTALMRASRRALLAHPPLVALLLARPGGRNALRLGEAALQLLAVGGVHGREAVEALRALLVYTLGFAAVAVPRAVDPAGEERVGHARERIASLPIDEFPATRAVADHLAQHPSERDFDAGLAWLIAGIARDARHSKRTSR